MVAENKAKPAPKPKPKAKQKKPVEYEEYTESEEEEAPPPRRRARADSQIESVELDRPALASEMLGILQQQRYQVPGDHTMPVGSRTCRNVKGEETNDEQSSRQKAGCDQDTECTETLQGYSDNQTT